MRFDVKFHKTEQSFPVTFKGLQTVTGTPDAEIYDGAYEVTPKADEGTTLPTAQKYLTQDVSVKKIPYYEVDNAAGGVTIYIGSDDEIIIE